MTESERWAALKQKLLVRFGTISGAARKMLCHPNALRGTASGVNPKVRQRLEKSGIDFTGILP